MWPIFGLFFKQSHPLQGFLLSELVSESCDKLQKQCLLCNENLMKNLEQLDSVVSSINLHVHTSLTFLIVHAMCIVALLHFGIFFGLKGIDTAQSIIDYSRKFSRG